MIIQQYLDKYCSDKIEYNSETKSILIDIDDIMKLLTKEPFCTNMKTFLKTIKKL